MNSKRRLPIEGFATMAGIIGLFASALYFGKTDARPHLPEHFKIMTPPSTAAVSEFRNKMANGGWIGRPQRELAELLGPPYTDHLACEGSSECAWLVCKIGDDGNDPSGVVVEELYTESGGFVETMDGAATRTAAREPAIHKAIFKEYHFRN